VSGCSSMQSWAMTARSCGAARVPRALSRSSCARAMRAPEFRCYRGRAMRVAVAMRREISSQGVTASACCLLSCCASPSKTCQSLAHVGTRSDGSSQAQACSLSLTSRVFSGSTLRCCAVWPNGLALSGSAIETSPECRRQWTERGRGCIKFRGVLRRELKLRVSETPAGSTDLRLRHEWCE
jgi:hypothetical protein